LSYQFLLIPQSDWNSGYDLLLQAFSQEFVDEEPVSLLISCKDEDESYFKTLDLIENIKKKPYCPKILVSSGFYPLSNTVVFLFRENIDFETLKLASEFAENIIVPDYFNIESNNIIPVETTLSFDSDINKYWYEANINDLRRVLRKIYQDRNIIHLKKESLVDIIENFELTYSKKEIDFNSDIKKTLSVCILAKNEEEIISNAIKSVQSFADEILILDTGSEDKTIKISKDLGCQVFSYEWENDFSKARNKLISLAKSDWILMLDSDEVINYESSKLIKILLSTLDNKKTYSNKIINFMDSDNNINNSLIHYMPRLIPNNNKFEYTGKIHETIKSKDNNDNFLVNIQEIEIYHYGYKKSKIKEKNKLIRNKEILETSILENNSDISSLYHLAINFREELKYKDYFETLKKIESLNLDNAFYLESKILILDALILLNDIVQAEVYAKNLYEEAKESVNYLFLYSEILYRLDRYQESIDIAKVLLNKKNHTSSLFLDSAIKSWKVLLLLTNSYYKLGDIVHARIFCKKTIKEAPLDLKTSKLFIDLYSKIILK
jgi:hypothetical protein